MDQGTPDVKARPADPANPKSPIEAERIDPQTSAEPPGIDLGFDCDTLRGHSIRMFSKGQKVVCINDDFPPEAAVLFAELPKKDQVYTVRGMYIGRGNYYRHDSGKKDGEIGLLLEEVLNPRDPALKTGLNGELGFNSERFAPLETDQESASAEEEEEFALPTSAA